MRKGLSCCSRAAAAAALLLLLMPAAAAEAQEITYTFSGVIRVLDLSSPAPGDGPGVPGADPLGLDGSAVLLVCAIDSATAPSFSGPNGDGAFAFYNAGIATLAITGSSGGVDGTYVDMPCSVRVDDFPVGSSFGGDKLSLTTSDIDLYEINEACRSPTSSRSRSRSWARTPSPASTCSPSRRPTSSASSASTSRARATSSTSTAAPGSPTASRHRPAPRCASPR